MTNGTRPSSPDRLLRHWIATLPGMIEADSAQECVRLSYRTAGVQNHCTVNEWEAAMFRAGFSVRQMRNKWRLSFPEKSPGQRRRPYHE